MDEKQALRLDLPGPGMPDDELLAWLALNRVPGLGPERIRVLVQILGSAAAVLALPSGELDGLELPEKSLAGLRRPDWSAAEADLAWRDRADKHILPLTDPRYPRLLAELADAPALLFVHGDPGLLAVPQLAIVGTRSPTALGRECAQEFARTLAGAGLVVTSGLALGIDGAAHEGALAGGRTIAVAGTGLDRVYPARHKALAHRIVDAGALVSEFAPGTAVHPSNFPRRNRIIAGLARGTLVVEAALASGSLITARLALDAGREVFAIPGSIHNPLAKGCHALIRQGAKLVETAQDILEELGSLAPMPVLVAPAAAPSADPASALDETDAAVLAAVDYGPTPVDQVVSRTGLGAAVVSGALLGLELRGLLALCPGGYQRLS